MTEKEKKENNAGKKRKKVQSPQPAPEPAVAPASPEESAATLEPKPSLPTEEPAPEAPDTTGESAPAPEPTTVPSGSTPVEERQPHSWPEGYPPPRIPPEERRWNWIDLIRAIVIALVAALSLINFIQSCSNTQDLNDLIGNPETRYWEQIGK